MYQTDNYILFHSCCFFFFCILGGMYVLKIVTILMFRILDT